MVVPVSATGSRSGIWQRRKHVVETSISMLERLRDGTDLSSWQRFVDLYMPLIRGWLRHHGLQDTDADDLVQEVLAVLPQELPAFEHRGAGAFRSWLRTMTVNRLRNFWRARQARPAAIGGSDLDHVLDQLEDPPGPAHTNLLIR
jgi:RNA polymerase sigma-70 factor (ECF subfamily)